MCIRDRVKTIVTTELIPAIAKDYGVDYMDCYTGFKLSLIHI